ncbi:MAG TPA: penicillin acylase family protein [Candidatus Hydrogenedentes bacterium]|nr:penicillin acylase family protein [Candidatus Hydrogenedentota bacterium]
MRRDTHLAGWLWTGGVMLLYGLTVLVVCGCSDSPATIADVSESAAKAATPPLPEPAHRLAHWPVEEDMPVPPDGWYTVELGGEKIDIFRDEYGVPHIYAPSIEGALRGQGYVQMEDRTIQIIQSLAEVRGISASYKGAEGIGHDEEIRTRGYTEEECREMVAALRPDLRGYLEAFVDGANAYLAKVAPGFAPIEPHEMAAGAAYHMAKAGDWGGEELSVYQLASMAKLFRGPEFMCQIINDAIPQNVPCSPTTDHSYQRAGHVEAASTPIPLDFDPSMMLAIMEDEERERQYAYKNGLMTTWGSFSWIVGPKRSATGNALLFGAPMVWFPTPSWCIMVHLNAPGFNVAGMACHGAPGILIGHNERVAWATTSSLLNATDFFEETLNPDDEHQYWHKGAWHDMEAIEWPILVKEADGSLREEPYTVYRTVHGPVVQWDLSTHRAYARATPFRYLELDSMMAFLDINRAKTLDDVETAVRQVATTHNFFAADTEGNIGYWVSGRFPVRTPGYDDRLPTPGTGEYDWRGYRNATDEVACINPPEGWFANWNNKPSVKTPGWFPEGTWGVKIFESLEANEEVGWDEFLAIIQANGEHNFLATYFKPYLVDTLRARPDLPPNLREAADLLENWPDKDVTGSPGALLFNRWMAEMIVELFAPDFGVMVSRDMGLDNLRLFATLAYRVLMPERRCFDLQGEYLHGRDPREVVYQAFVTTYDSLVEEQGPDINKWAYDRGVWTFGLASLEPAGTQPQDDSLTVPQRNVGTYWMAVELGNPIKAFDVVAPGQCGNPKSPHYVDQVPLFRDFKMKPMKFYRDELPPYPG